jgi:tetrahydromethanopterin S-methyltransferase subunit D
VSGREEPESYVHADVAVGEVLVPCSCYVVAVGGALKPCRSTAVGAVGTLLTSPCFRRGLRTAVVMEHARCHHYLFFQGEPDGTPVLFHVA